MNTSAQRRLLNFVLQPLLRRLGYQNDNKNYGIPKSHYYEGRTGFGDLAELHRSYLLNSGWLESRNTNLSYYKGGFQPWITFAATHFLSTLNMANFRVLEFGGGASTIWFSKRARSVTTYEFDSAWGAALSEYLEHFSNTEVLVPNLEIGLLEAWSRSKDLNPGLDNIDILGIKSDPFVDSVRDFLVEADIIFIDGGPRNLALFLASEFASSTALVVVDNAETGAIHVGLQLLRKAGFVEIPFQGLGPINTYEWRTSVFARSLNSLN